MLSPAGGAPPPAVVRLEEPMRRAIVAAPAFTRIAALVVAAVVALGRPGTAAAAEPGGAYLLRMGRDTLALERFERAGGGLSGTIAFRVTRMRIDWKLALAPDGSPLRMETEYRVAGDAPDAAPKQSATLEFRGDSVFADARPGGLQRLGTKPGAMPFVNPSMALVAALAARVMPAPGGKSDAAFFMLAGGGTIDVTVTRPAADSVVVAFAGISFCLHLDSEGDVVSGRVPEQGLDIERVPALPAELLAMPKADYSAPVGAPYTAEEVRVGTRGGFTLAGTLTRPVTSRAAPCVVTITGSGPEDRDESIAMVNGYRPFREVADALGRRGIAVLRLDDRGVGGSGGAVRGATSESFAGDIEDALAWLRTRPDIDGDRLALVGHSEGGLIAPMIAARDPKLRAIVLMAAPAWTGRRVTDYQNRYAIDRHFPAASRDSVLRASRTAVDSLAASSAWLRFFLDYDPLPALRRVKVPVLILQGQTDRQVPFEQASELARALAKAGNRSVVTKIYPATNHLFLPDPDGNPAGYARLSRREIGDPVMSTLGDWLARQLK
jgi:hypothetical protein